MDTPREIMDAAWDALERGYTKYAPAAGYPELRNALAKKLRDYNQIDLDPETQILITQGSTEALYLAVNALLDPGEEAIIPAPYYPPYDSLIKASGATPRYVGATEDEGWLPAPEAIEKAVNKRTRALLINTPNNPTGTVYPRKYLEDIGRTAVDHDLPILSDEAYEALVFDGAEHVSPMSIPSMRDNAIGLFSFSKTFAMTGEARLPLWPRGIHQESRHHPQPRAGPRQFSHPDRRPAGPPRVGQVFRPDRPRTGRKKKNPCG